jgi:three-Cys-motif partner protein
MAWFPIMSKQYSREGITFLDGFAGPGEYTNSPESSPVIALTQACRPDVVQHRAPTRFAFIDEDVRRTQNLGRVIDTRFPLESRPSHVTLEVTHGQCHEVYEQTLNRLGAFGGPILANLDGWGADTHYSVVQRIASHRSSEVIVTFQGQFFYRFADVTEDQGNAVFGNTDWKAVTGQPSDEKKAFLAALYRQRLLDAGFRFVLPFEMIDESGHSLFQFFGTKNQTAVERFKDGLWKVDGLGGQRFRDPRQTNQLAFDIEEPDFWPLARTIEALLEERGQENLATLKTFAITDTIYRGPHVTDAMGLLLRDGRVRQLAHGRADSDKVYELTPARLF